MPRETVHTRRSSSSLRKCGAEFVLDPRIPALSIHQCTPAWWVGRNLSCVCVNGHKQLLKLATATCGGEVQVVAPHRFHLQSTRLHDLAQRVVGRDLIEFKRSRALRTYGRGLKGCARTIARLSVRGLHAPRRRGSGGAW